MRFPNCSTPRTWPRSLRRLKESVTEFKADCDSLPDRLQLVLKNLGVPEAEFVEVRPGADSESRQDASGDCDDKEPTALVGAIAHAKTRNRTARRWGRASSQPRRSWIACGRPDGTLFSAVAQIQDDRKTDADRSSRMSARGSRPTNMPWLVAWPASCLTPKDGPSSCSRRQSRLTQIPPIEPPPPVPGPAGNRSAPAARTRLSLAEWHC